MGLRCLQAGCPLGVYLAAEMTMTDNSAGNLPPELDIDLDSVWTGVAAEVWATPPGRIERLAAHLLRSQGLARALMTTPSLVLSWIFASAVVLVVGVLATSETDVAWVPLLAPALAGIGIAYAYGPGVDPAFELSQTMAISDRMVLLVRAVAVFGLNAILGMAASLFSASTVDITLLWLLPMTAVSMFGLAAATLARSANVGVAAALAGWAVVVLAGARGGDIGTAVERHGLIPLYLLTTIICLGMTLYATSDGRNGGLQWQ